MGKAPFYQNGPDLGPRFYFQPKKRKSNKKRRVLFSLLILLLVAGIGVAGYKRISSKIKVQARIVALKPPAPQKGSSTSDIQVYSKHMPLEKLEAELEKIKKPELLRVSDQIRRGESLSLALARFDISHQDIHYLAKALKKKLNLRGIQPGDVFVLEKNDEPLSREKKKGRKNHIKDFDAFEIIRTDTYGIPIRYRAERVIGAGNNNPDSYLVKKISPPIQVRVRGLAGQISSSLYESILAAGGDPTLVNRFADIFGWQVDFYRETRANDWFKVLVEENYVDGRFVGYGRVVAAEYGGQSKIHNGYLFGSTDGLVKGVYSDKGLSLEKTFLKSPLELARITSRYGQRFHPVLKRRKKHNGVDYGAPVGTPFWTVADGVVKEAKYSRSAGNMVRIQHSNGYMTEFFHLSKFAKGVKKGKKVKQRQIIGYVGTTGRSTGPHLHYGMKKNDRYVNPSRQNFPAGKPVAKQYMEEYLRDIAPRVSALEALDL